MLPFEDSRRLTGANLFFAQTGAQLETCALAVDATLLAGWRVRVQRARVHLGWSERQSIARAHAGGASLAIAAPADVLFTATEVNEWALCATVAGQDPLRGEGLEAQWAAAALEEAADPANLIPPVLEEAAALERFTRLMQREARPRLRALLAVAAARGLPYVLDDEVLSVGAGIAGCDLALDALPEPEELRWELLRDIPTAAVTGSNGKTTSVRLLAACAQAHGWPAAYCCTDGVFIGAQSLASGDYSGPVGARTVMRTRAAQAAVIECARGGILRRGLAISQAKVALVTNVSADHFGEYGIDDLAGLADVKLSIAGLVPVDGLVVLNADDPLLRQKAPQLAARFAHPVPLGWFARNADLPALREHRERGGAVCGVRDGRLILHHDGATHDLGAVAAMPLTVEGTAAYNIANLAGAALAAAALGVPAPTIAQVFARFGARASDNFGRMMRFERDGVHILVDYAHNPEGLKGLLEVAQHLRGSAGRLGMLLGHAGNRRDADIEALANTAAAFRPDLIVIKENESQLRGRAAGEIPRLIHAALRSAGFSDAVLPQRGSEIEAAHCALEWARAGDVLALPVHSSAARAALLALLSQSDS